MEIKEDSKDKLIKTGLTVGGGVAVLGTGLLIMRKIRKRKRNSDGTTSKVAPSLKNAKIEKTNLTISVSDAAIYANTLYGAMQNWGTDEKTIYSTINKINTKDDMLLVIKTFGMKKYLLGGRASFLGQDLNLIGWLKKELKERQLARIKPKFDSWGIPL